MKKSNFFVGLLVCSMLLSQNCLASSYDKEEMEEKEKAALMFGTALMLFGGAAGVPAEVAMGVAGVIIIPTFISTWYARAMDEADNKRSAIVQQYGNIREYLGDKSGLPYEATNNISDNIGNLLNMKFSFKTIDESGKRTEKNMEVFFTPKSKQFECFNIMDIFSVYQGPEYAGLQDLLNKECMKKINELEKVEADTKAGNKDLYDRYVAIDKLRAEYMKKYGISTSELKKVGDGIVKLFFNM